MKVLLGLSWWSEDRFDIPKYMIGDIDNREFIHQYILGRPTFQMGLGWDNSDPFFWFVRPKIITLMVD